MFYSVSQGHSSWCRSTAGCIEVLGTRSLPTRKFPKSWGDPKFAGWFLWTGKSMKTWMMMSNYPYFRTPPHDWRKRRGLKGSVNICKYPLDKSTNEACGNNMKLQHQTFVAGKSSTIMILSQTCIAQVSQFDSFCPAGKTWVWGSPDLRRTPFFAPSARAV